MSDNVEELYNIYVECEKTFEKTRDADDGDRWDRGDSHTGWYFTGLKGKSTYYEDVVKVSFKPKNDCTYYLLVGIYSTADSFGTDTDSSAEIFDIYEIKNQAYDAEQQINETAHDNYIVYKNHQGVFVKLYNPWNGYFESLSEIRIEELTYQE